MKLQTATMVRIYITEKSHLLKPILNYLHDDAQVRGATVFRAVSGFGDSHQIHTANLVDLSLDLPLAIEFFDTPEKIETALEHLATMIDAEHIVCWSVQMNGT